MWDSISKVSSDIILARFLRPRCAASILLLGETDH
jgi:hypothetical protein